jgi:hypothetical protein
VAPSEAVADGAHPERRCAWISPPNTRPISSSSCSHSTSRSASLRGASMPSLRPSGGHCHAAGIATPTQEFVKLRGHLSPGRTTPPATRLRVWAPGTWRALQCRGVEVLTPEPCRPTLVAHSSEARLSVCSMDRTHRPPSPFLAPSLVSTIALARLLTAQSRQIIAGVPHWPCQPGLTG